ncbi:hypothetical protein [Bradyrhizobium sp. LMTR 3]|uniref:hypothetical protein n=1 Tax=Bradyrhizobium sp. LMTR 3 TaxID=189873 RepID=UPI0008108262|nr:hypothetical protein [Bradyrhizobium sp. LMTR 3]OCK59923.1 hypothetical protein LMTR3_20125 [Bradyrhizobium sp. LMTR 3]
MRKFKIALAVALATGSYFSLAYYFKVSYVEEVPNRDDIAPIYLILPTATPGSFFACLWLPVHVKRVVIYERGVPIGYSNAIYDNPFRTYSSAGRQWKNVEFNTKGEHVRRWVMWDNETGH